MKTYEIERVTLFLDDRSPSEKQLFETRGRAGWWLASVAEGYCSRTYYFNREIPAAPYREPQEP